MNLNKIIKEVGATSQDARTQDDGGHGIGDGDGDLSDHERAEWVRRVVDELGPLTDRDREVLGPLLAPGDQ